MPFLIFGLLIVMVFLMTVIFGAPYVPSHQSDTTAIVKSLKISDGIFIDLGCGDGKVLITAAKYGYTVVGYEINPILWLIAQVRVRRYGGKIYLKNYLSADITSASVIYLFTASPYVAKINAKLEKEVSPGTTIISNGFKLPSKHKPEVSHGAYIYHF